MAKRAAETVETIKFTDDVRHDRLRFLPGSVIGFKSKPHADYFVRCGWATPSKEKPQAVFEADELTIDPETIHHETGLKVKDIKTESEG